MKDEWAPIFDLTLRRHAETGLLMATSETHRGLNVAGHTVDEVLRDIPDCMKVLAEANQTGA